MFSFKTLVITLWILSLGLVGSATYMVDSHFDYVHELEAKVQVMGQGYAEAQAALTDGPK